MSIIEEFVNPNDVQRQHNCCLHVLGDATYLVKKMEALLRKNQNKDSSCRKFLERHSKSLESFAEIHKQLHGE